MVDVDQVLAKGVRVGVLEECLHEDQVVLLGQGAKMSHDRPVSMEKSNTRVPIWRRGQNWTEQNQARYSSVADTWRE